ncbi:MAG: radical SAM protein [Candidatus Omnitrophica bacterium]|nr:radical SAM protein [Candidatus Omnitrophota bacterium]
MDKYRIDSHKLLYHVDRVSDWLKGKNIYPIYMEIAPSGSCNHRCVYCGLDFMRYAPQFLDTKKFHIRLSEMASLGVKSIMYAGEGEPLLHKDIAAIVRHTKKCGIDAAITTNGVLLKEKLLKEMMPATTWIKVSVDAATPKTYAQIHNTREQDFNTMIENLTYAAGVRKKNHYACTLGMQLILLPQNYQEVVALAKKAKAIGMDYLVVKPYSQHPLSITTKYENIKYRRYRGLAEELRALNSKSFNVVFREHTMQKWDEGGHAYAHCLGLPFWAYIDACGNVWACSIYLSKEKFCLGNIYKNTFRQIMESPKRKKLLRFAQEKLDTSQCRVNCRMDEINRYLWDLKNPSEHVNFI